MMLEPTRGPTAAHGGSPGFLDEGLVLPVYIETRLNQLYLVSGQANHSFDEVLLRIHRIMKDNNVSAPDLLIRHQAVAEVSSSVAKFIDQKVVADQQRIHHRFGRNLEGLHHERDYEDRDHHSAQQRLQRTDQVRSHAADPFIAWQIVGRQIVWEIHQRYLSAAWDARAAAFPSAAFEWEAR